MKNFRIHVLFVALLLSTASIRCSSGADLLKTGSSLLSSLGGNPALSQITSLLQTPGLGKMLGGVLKKPFTLLAPTNDALSKLGADALGKLASPDNLGQLANLLKNQIVPGKHDAAGLAGLKSAGGKALDLTGANLGSLVSGDKFNILPIDKLLN